MSFPGGEKSPAEYHKVSCWDLESFKYASETWKRNEKEKKLVLAAQQTI